MQVVKISLGRLIDAIASMQENKFDCNIFIEGNRGIGKCQIAGNKVLMANGEWKNIEDIKIGDEVISPQKDGSYVHAKVIDTHERFEEEVYEVREATRKKKLLYSCAGNHDIPILRISHPRKKEDGIYRGKRASKQVSDLKTAKEISEMYTQSSHICGFTTTAINYKTEDCEIDAYTLGAWLGDGSFMRDKELLINLGERKKEVIEHIKTKYPVMSEYKYKEKKCTRYRFSVDCELMNLLRKYKLKTHSKFIPKEAMLSSVKYRWDLLAGLIDTDGYISNKNNHIDIVTKYSELGNDIINLIFSLGGHATIKKIKKKAQTGKEGIYYLITISFENPKDIPLKTKIKKERLGNKMKHSPRHIAIQVIKTNPQKVYGFELDKSQTESQWYITDNWMITHNSTLAWHICNRAKNHHFNPSKDILFRQEQVIDFFNNEWFSTGWADEMVNVAFNRDFYSENQKRLIKIMNMNRDHCNLFIACIPRFTALDTQIKQMCKIRITVIRRGVGIIQTPLASIYTADRWDTKNNEKVERGWNKYGNWKPKYSQLTTFKGVITFPDMTDRQKEIYQQIKNEQRNEIVRLEQEQAQGNENPFDKLYKMLDGGQITTREEFDKLCLLMNLKPINTMNNIRNRMRNAGDFRQMSDFFGKTKLVGNNSYRVTNLNDADTDF